MIQIRKKIDGYKSLPMGLREDSHLHSYRKNMVHSFRILMTDARICRTLTYVNTTTNNMKSEKTKKIIYWVLTGLVSFVFLGSATGKLTGNEEAFKMAADFGIDAKTYTMIGVAELISLILFILPRTGVVGTILLSAYMGGAIASHAQHGLPILAPSVILTFVLLVSFYRFPELVNRLLNRQS